MTMFVDSAGVIRFFGPYQEKPKVGPVFTKIDGHDYFTAGLTVAEIHHMRPVIYQQPQIGN